MRSISTMKVAQSIIIVTDNRVLYEQSMKLFLQLSDKRFHISPMKLDPSPPPNCRRSKLIVPINRTAFANKNLICITMKKKS